MYFCLKLQSASSWGCELKYRLRSKPRNVHRSASSWGCELKYLAAIMRWYFCVVSLFVRLWVEILRHWPCDGITGSASSWGCELKFYETLKENGILPCQPLREAVSWNNLVVIGIKKSMRSASSWGCELKLSCMNERAVCSRQPLREAVSWNSTAINIHPPFLCQPLREAVSWNASIWAFCASVAVSLFVRLWVEIEEPDSTDPAKYSQPLREAVSWNSFVTSNI